MTSDSANPIPQSGNPLPSSANSNVSNSNVSNSSGPNSTGLGLANIRDRLAQAYGENQIFETTNRPEGGFQVVLELPFEAREFPPAFAELPPRRALATLDAR